MNGQIMTAHTQVSTSYTLQFQRYGLTLKKLTHIQRHPSPNHTKEIKETITVVI